MNDSSRNSRLFIFLIAIVIFIAASKFIAPAIVANSWAFTQWQYLPLWCSLGVTAVCLSLVYVAWKQSSGVIVFFEKKNSQLIVGGLLLAAAILFCFDSILYAGGNLTVARISQADVIIKRLHEWGAVHLVSWLFYLFKSVFSFLTADNAAALAWSTVSWLSGLLSLWWGWQSSRFLTTDRALRTLITTSIFLGPHAALFFGFVAPEPLVIAFTIGVTRFALEYFYTQNTKPLLWVWCLLLLSIVCYTPCLYLLPAAAYVTFTPLKTNSNRGLILAALTGIVLIAALYYLASQNLELTSHILFFEGKNPNSDYGMFSLRHIGDMLQLFLVFAPQILIAGYLFFTRKVPKELQKAVTLLTIMTCSGIVVTLLINPVQSIVLDFPVLLAYLSPVQLLAVVLLTTSPAETPQPARQNVLAFTAVSLFVLLSWFPLNRSILNSQDYAEAYFKQHDNFYRAGSFSFRDALFAADKKEVADIWERKLATKSPEYIDLEGCRNLALKNNETEALRELYKLKVHHPFWGDPRYVLAGIQMRLGRPQLAAPELDTALMLEPYNKSYLMAKYSLYRDTRAYDNALGTITHTLKFYPSDSLVLSDYMLVSYRAGDIAKSDSLRRILQERFPNLPYPFFIEGLIAEGRGNLQQAQRAYEKFIAIAPDDPDVPRVRKMLNDVVLKLRNAEN